MSAYLQNLTIRLAQGVGRLPQQVRQRHIDYFLAAQQPDGGFAGREGGSEHHFRGAKGDDGFNAKTQGQSSTSI